MFEQLSGYIESMDKCSRCGFCEATCPVFLADLLETHVARSRMMIIREALIDKNLADSKRFREIVNRCLLCSRCQQTCPANVPVDEIVVAARYQLYKGKRMALPRRLLLKQVMENRGLKGLLKKAESLAKMVGVKLGDFPEIPRRQFSDDYQGTITPDTRIRDRVAYYVGCATNAMFPSTGLATVNVLNHNGIEVTIPPGIVCCGIPALSEGDLQTARNLMETNLDILANLDVDVILTDCTSCGFMFKERLLKLIPPEDPLYEKATLVSSKIYDVTDYISTLGLSEKPGRRELNYTYHVPCHGHWIPDVTDCVPDLLSAIPESKYSAMEDPEQCCGAAGAFFIDHKDLSNKIREPKIENIASTNAGTVVTQCPSCRLYIASGMPDKDVMHPVEVLAESYGLVAAPEKK